MEEINNQFSNSESSIGDSEDEYALRIIERENENDASSIDLERNSKSSIGDFEDENVSRIIERENENDASSIDLENYDLQTTATSSEILELVNEEKDNTFKIDEISNFSSANHSREDIKNKESDVANYYKQIDTNEKKIDNANLSELDDENDFPIIGQKKRSEIPEFKEDEFNKIIKNVNFSSNIASANLKPKTPLKSFENDAAIIIDLGSGMIKSGFSGEDSPRHLTPSIVGKPRYQQMLHGHYSSKLFYVGNEAQTRRGILSIKYPIANGIIVDWDQMELLWNYVFDQELQINPTSHRVLLTDPPLNPKLNRELILEYMFEKYNVDATYLAISAVLSLYATGLTTGLVVNSGDAVTHTVPIFEGYPVPRGIIRSNLGGRNLTNYMVRLLTESGVYLNSSAGLEIARDLKEKCCYIASDLDKFTMKSIVNDDNMDYELPDGKVLHLKNQRYNCPELIFNPSLIGMEDPGLAQMVNLTVQRCEIDLRRSLYDRMILAGGNTLFPNLERRLKVEIERDSPIKVKANIVAEPDRLFSAWIGASILSMVPTFQKMWINKREYEEEGVRIVHKKCF